MKSFMPVAFTIAALAVSSPAADAAQATSRGEISVAQVTELLDRAPANDDARQVLTIYLTGVGETAGFLLDAADASAVAGCRASLSLSPAAVRRALAGSSGGQRAVETAATPLILRDMLRRAGCRLAN
ncbi:MAG: chlorophyllide reductase [Rhizobiaceae bacterium]|nr:chlorophyllide reductase [Rhizobiaceae bacterium]MCV0408220.1 chlorophyllide reductase [Rhizobiaceae bacterium]